MKNVTGYDLSKLICGSYGTLAVFDEVIFKTLPRPETNISLLFGCEDMTAAVAKIASVFASPHEPNAAAILPGSMAASAGNDVKVLVAGMKTMSGIDPGDLYFLSPTTAGAITTTAPTGSGQAVTRVGEGATSTSFSIYVEPPVKLA